MAALSMSEKRDSGGNLPAQIETIGRLICRLPPA